MGEWLVMRETERVRLKLIDGSQYEGDLLLEGKSRATDVLNQSGDFIVLTRISIAEKISEGTIILNKAHILTIVPVKKQPD